MVTRGAASWQATASARQPAAWHQGPPPGGWPPPVRCPVGGSQTDSGTPRSLPLVSLCYAYAFCSCIARQTRSGVYGMSRCCTPKWESASTTAFATAGVEPIVPASPAPLAPMGLTVDDITDVIDRDVLDDFDQPRVAIDLDHANVRAERECAVRRIVIGNRLQCWLHAWWQVVGDVGLEGNVLDGLDRIRRSLHPGLPILVDNVLRRRLQHVRRKQLGLLDNLLHALVDGGTADGQ